MQIVIPAAGLGSRFAAQDYKLPKPLINVNGKTMISRVVDCFAGIEEVAWQKPNFIFIVQQEHCKSYGLDKELERIAPGCTIIQINGQTEGAACTVLLAKEHINSDEELIVANSDQIFEIDWEDFFYTLDADVPDGVILTFDNNHPKWSYVKTNTFGYVTEVKEKQVISNHATVGVYYFEKGSDAVWAIEDMISKNLRFKGEFYFCPAYQQLIDAGKYIITYEVDKMVALGTPEDLELHLKGN
jgi:dTDP-glucose pyrophosphorylase